MRRLVNPLLLLLATGCSHSARPFAFREPFLVDTDTNPVSIPCRAEPTDEDPNAKRCAPREYVSPFIWDQLDNLMFARISRALNVETTGESRNVNSLDEVPDSSWFTNSKSIELPAHGSCTAEEILAPPEEVAAGEWVIDHGKDNGSTLGFRVNIPGKGKYMLKTDEQGKPDRATAASVIGAAAYVAIGFNSSCEQIVAVKQEQFKLEPGLTVISNRGITTPLDDEAVKKILASSTQLPGGTVRMQASHWLPGLALGPFRYIGTRSDDPNDIIDHADRRELRGSRLLAAWLDHWDAREQNSMDVWLAVNAEDKRSSPGVVRHYILDTSDTLGEEVSVDDLSRRLGHAYLLDFGEIGRALFTLGIEERPWDRAKHERGLENLGYFSDRDFDPELWRPFYPNPAFVRMTERDAAWMARKIARFSPDDVRKLVALARWNNRASEEHVYRVLMWRQRKILARYLTRLSPLGDVHNDGRQVCATDFARLRDVYPAARFRYSVTQRGHGGTVELPVTATGSLVCVTPRATERTDVPDADPRRRVQLVVDNGIGAKKLVIHAYDLGVRGMKIVGLTR